MTMNNNENNFNSLVSIIKIEPEEFQASQESSTSVSDEILRQRAKIFSDPVLLLERVVFKKKRCFDRKSALKLAEKGNEGKNKFEKQTCSLCKRVLTNRNYLVFHLMRVHNQGPKLFCDLCPKTFRTKAQMIQHMRSHMRKAFPCNICDFKTAYKENLERHKKAHLKQEKCKICNKQVASLKDHLINHKKEPCPICKQIFSKNYMKKHIKQVHDDKKCKCSDCSSTFSTKEALRRHKLEQHYVGKLYRCHCGSVFRRKSKFNQHQSCHKNKKRTCQVCKKNCFNLYSLKRHYRLMHLNTHGPMQIEGIPEKQKTLNFGGPFICDKCGKTFMKRASFSQHFHFQHSVKLFRCDLCPKSFNYKNRLAEHMQGNHLKANPFTCEVCGRETKNKNNLKIHKLQHESKKECKICHKMVTNLYCHMKVHIRVKCQICSLTFSKTWLPRHIKANHK